jgi:hypothetical protein
MAEIRPVVGDHPVIFLGCPKSWGYPISCSLDAEYFMENPIKIDYQLEKSMENQSIEK